jgi:hypothetical protein
MSARAWIVLVALVAAGACGLQDLTLVEAEDMVVADVYVELSGGTRGESRATAWLHHTLENGFPSSMPVPGARVVVKGVGGLVVPLSETADSVCVSSTPVTRSGSCYAADTALVARIKPGDALQVEISLPGGGSLRGASTVPGDFRLLTPPAGPICGLEAYTPLETRWTRSGGAWAYVSETQISGLRKALAPRSISVPGEPFYMRGLSMSAADTTVVFPGGLGYVERFEVDRDLWDALQEGLPWSTDSRVTITAADRNYVNWNRMENFNPSGLVRVPSLRGDGTGVFATSVTRSFRAIVPAQGAQPRQPRCRG